jgi:hypothetical protein
MSKQVSNVELAEVVTRLLTKPEEAGELDTTEKFAGFMTKIAEVVCYYCGGEVHREASQEDDTFYIGIHGNDSLPEGGGIWSIYDPEGDLNDDPNPPQLSLL